MLDRFKGHSKENHPIWVSLFFEGAPILGQCKGHPEENHISFWGGGPLRGPTSVAPRNSEH